MEKTVYEALVKKFTYIQEEIVKGRKESWQTELT